MVQRRVLEYGFETCHTGDPLSMFQNLFHYCNQIMQLLRDKEGKALNSLCSIQQTGSKPRPKEEAPPHQPWNQINKLHWKCQSNQHL